MRHHLSPNVRKIMMIVGISLILIGAIGAGMSVFDSRTIAQNDFLTNSELLAMRSEAGENPEVLATYTKKRTEMSNSYRSARKNQTFIVTFAMSALVMGSLLLKVRKNLARK